MNIIWLYIAKIKLLNNEEMNKNYESANERTPELLYNLQLIVIFRFNNFKKETFSKLKKQIKYCIKLNNFVH